jgi:FkbM family methyltransferase
MASAIKKIGRGILRAYLTYTPVKKGRYPLMIALHKYFKEPVIVQVRTKDRGIMVLQLDDEMQFTMYYNMFENIYLRTMNSLIEGVDVAIDVGGNVGQYALLFAQKAKKVYAFEPMPVMIERLEEHVALNHLQEKLKIIPKALSNVNGTLELSIPPADNSGVASTVIDKTGNTQTIVVESITLDNFLAAEKVARVGLIKMDIEGAELFALQGMKKTIADNKPVLIMEMNEPAMHRAGYKPSDVVDFLKSYGYSPFEIVREGIKSCEEIDTNSENFCFLTKEHLSMEKVQRILIK